MLGWIGSALSAASGLIGGAVKGITSVVGGLLSNPAVQKAASAAVSAAASTLAKPSSPSKPSSHPRSSVPIKSDDKGDEGKNKTLLYIALGGVALVAVLLILKR